MADEELVIGLLEIDDPEFEVEIEVEIEVKRETLVLIVFAPKDVEPKRFRFRIEETVERAAHTAAEAFGYAAGSPSFQRADGQVLDRALTLKRACLHNRERVELVDAGGGV